jgi:hypothetical protein
MFGAAIEIFGQVRSGVNRQSPCAAYALHRLKKSEKALLELGARLATPQWLRHTNTLLEVTADKSNGNA